LFLSSFSATFLGSGTGGSPSFEFINAAFNVNNALFTGEKWV
jgi:hypothetical protein